MNTQIRLALSIISVLCLSLLICGSGGASNGVSAITPSATPAAIVTGLDVGITYYFAVSAFNGIDGSCSNEVSSKPRSSGAVSLAWDPVKNQNVSAYVVHYGTKSPNKPGDCTYDKWVRVTLLP
jgi:hypothetical protein